MKLEVEVEEASSHSYYYLLFAVDRLWEHCLISEPVVVGEINGAAKLVVQVSKQWRIADVVKEGILVLPLDRTERGAAAALDRAVAAVDMATSAAFRCPQVIDNDLIAKGMDPHA
jgi:hypothetical protein